MNKAKQPFDICPVCESEELLFYDTSSDEKSGKYKCLSCGRSTTWAIAKTVNTYDYFKGIFGV